MAEPIPEVASQVAESEPTPITNGTTATEAEDVTMVDPIEIPASTEVINTNCMQGVLLTLRSHHRRQLLHQKRNQNYNQKCSPKRNQSHNRHQLQRQSQHPH